MTKNRMDIPTLKAWGKVYEAALELLGHKDSVETDSISNSDKAAAMAYLFRDALASWAHDPRRIPPHFLEYGARERLEYKQKPQPLEA